MTKGLAQRREKVLKIIVNEYISTAAPVASETVIRNHNLGVSSATIRNDMAYLEEESYIARPYSSSGCVPLDKAYRYYVESLTETFELPLEEQRRIRKAFSAAQEEYERWLKLAAALLSHLVGNAAMVTFPKVNQCRFKRLELVSMNEFLALMVVVLSNAVLRRQMLSFTQKISQEELNILANKLNETLSGLSGKEIADKAIALPRNEKKVIEAVEEIMGTEDSLEEENSYVEGLRLMLGQPEFTQRDRMLGAMEAIEAKGWLKPILGGETRYKGVKVLIGEESREESLYDLSLVFSRYGIRDRVSGAVCVIGPKRMDYHRAISTVGYVSGILSDMVVDVCGT